MINNQNIFSVRPLIEKIALGLVLLLSLTVFLPYQVTASATVALSLLFLLLKGVREHVFKRRGIFFGLGFLALTATVALICGNYVGFRRTLVFAALLGVATVVRALADRSFFEKLMNTFVLGGCLATVHCIIEFVLNRNVEGYRCQGFFTNPNFFGTALTFVILICAYKASTHANKVWIYYAAAIFNAVGLYLCGSMSLWLVAAVCIIIMLILHREFKLLAIFLSVVGLAVVALLAIPGLIHRLGELSETIDNRIKIWSFAIDSFKDAPLFGRGFYTYKFLYSQLPQPTDVYRASMSHSIYLDSLLCHGIIGTVAAVVAFGSYFKSLFSCRYALKKQGQPSPITGFIIALSVALALYGLMDTTFIWIQTGFIVVMIAAGLGVEEKSLKE